MGDPSRLTDRSESLAVLLSRCRNLSFPDSLPEVSIVFIFVNEALSVLLRSIHSAIERTPPHLLKEIILVDDNSSNGERPSSPPWGRHPSRGFSLLLGLWLSRGSPWLLLLWDVASMTRDSWWSLPWKVSFIGVSSLHPTGAWSSSFVLLTFHSSPQHSSVIRNPDLRPGHIHSDHFWRLFSVKYHFI